VLLLLGFTLHDMADMFRQPHEEALAQGKFARVTTVWVDGPVVAGTRSFELTVTNPTRRELFLEGEWSESPGRYEVKPATVRLSVPPRQSRTKQFSLSVTPRDGIPVAEFKSPVLTGAWTWQRWAAEGETPQALKLPVSIKLKVLRAFGAVNYAVLGAYFIGMLAIGYLASRRITTTRSYFIADGKLNYIVAGLSILGTYLSALTMMGLPGASYGEHDWTYVVQLPCLIITAMVITGVVLPRYRAAGVVSIYEYLEQRIHVSTRVIAAVSFLVFGIGRMGLVLYLPALAISTVTGLPLWLCILGMGLVVTVYTVMGGIEAVAWTDVVQVIVFVVGAFLTLGYIFSQLSVSTFIDIGLQYNKFRIIAPKPGAGGVVNHFDVTQITTLWLVLETIFQTIRIYGTQQDMAQRYMTTESTEKAARSVWISILAYIPIGFIFYLIGTALFAFYKAHPDVNLPGKADPVYPYFIVNHMPPGVAGLVIAAIFAAAMSSIDSVMNSASTVCVEDLYKRFGRKGRTESEYLRLARRLTILWGALAIVMGLFFMEIQYAQIVWGKLMGISTNGILGLMALAFLPIRINKWAAALGFAFSYVCLFVMMGIGINFLLWPVIGNVACFLVAFLVNPLFSMRESSGPPAGIGA
jgi:SSS family solute:Na+ symporter